jgi:hypothetical protein
MIEVLIFYIHVIFLVYIFSRTFIQEKFASALLSAIFIVIIFSVGWTFSAFVIALFIPPQGLTKILTRAAFSLALLTIFEIIFYKFYFSKKPVKDKPRLIDAS